MKIVDEDRGQEDKKGQKVSFIAVVVINNEISYYFVCRL